MAQNDIIKIIKKFPAPAPDYKNIILNTTHKLEHHPSGLPGKPAKILWSKHRKGRCKVLKVC